mmetsp:Transcript_55602/g.113656  ORF Transcript_55602/g.113656 Transcript_55602/m.113656 type:complete len:143 (+) Transcript_55602:55-483(+)
MANIEPFLGKCLCGGVTYKVSAAPVTSLMCICTECQTIGGGFGVGSVVAPQEAVTVETGSDLLQEFQMSGSTKGVTRRFCKTCGTHVFANNPAYPLMAVHAGTLDDASKFEPKVAIWCQSKRVWHRIPEEVPQFDQYPPPPQ